MIQENMSGYMVTHMMLHHDVCLFVCGPLHVKLASFLGRETKSRDGRGAKNQIPPKNYENPGETEVF